MQSHGSLNTLRRTLLLVGLAGVAGCATINPNRGYTTWRYVEPPQRSIEPPAAAPTSKPSPPPQTPTPTYESQTSRPPTADEATAPEVTIRQKLDAPAPSLGSGTDNAAATQDLLTLSATGPAGRQVGEPIEFSITIGNRGGAGLKNVVLECDFGAGLEFPGRREKQVRRPLGTLAGGATQTFSLALTPLSDGQQCAVFKLSADGESPVTREVWVRVEASPVELTIIGPEWREVGQRAEFVLTVHNRSGRALSDARVQVRHDAALAAREASAGVERTDGLLTWNLGTLQKDERIQIQMEFECLKPEPRACPSVRITTADTATSREACVEVRAAGAGLTLSLADSVDPVAVGEKTVQQLIATNRGTTPITDWSIELTLSDAVALETVQVTKPLLSAVEQQQTAGGTVLLPKLPSLAAGETLQIDLVLQALHEGRVDVRAAASTGATTVSTVEPTLINPPAAGAPSL
jgi:hypothetical protein